MLGRLEFPRVRVHFHLFEVSNDVSQLIGDFLYGVVVHIDDHVAIGSLTDLDPSLRVHRGIKDCRIDIIHLVHESHGGVGGNGRTKGCLGVRSDGHGGFGGDPVLDSLL